MKLKIAIALFVLALSFFLPVGRSGSAKIRGKWKTQTSDGENIEMDFKRWSVFLNDDEYYYEQNASGIEDGVRYYGIEIDDEPFSIIFPGKDRNVAMMIKPDTEDSHISGFFIFAMHRKTQPKYEEYGKKYIAEN